MNEAADEDLTALLDGQLEEADRTEVVRRLAADLRLQHRFDALAQARGSLDAAFAGMLAAAPVARLRATLPASPYRWRFSTLARVQLAASFAIATALSAALAAWLTFNVMNVREDWVTAVVEYMQLYTPETFAGLTPDPKQEAAIVAKVGARLGVGVAPETLALPGLVFKTAFVLSYGGAALGEFVFTDAAGAPYLFCILAEGAAPSGLRWDARQSFTVATWGRRDERFLVIGPSAEIIRNWSRTLASRVG